MPTAASTQKFPALETSISMSATERYSSLGKDGKKHIQRLSQRIIYKRWSSFSLLTCLLVGEKFLWMTWTCIFGMWIPNCCSAPHRLSVQLGMDGVTATNIWQVKSVVQLCQPKPTEGASHTKWAQQINTCRQMRRTSGAVDCNEPGKKAQLVTASFRETTDKNNKPVQGLNWDQCTRLH